MRLFIAVNFNDEVKRRILTVQEKIRALTVKGKFSRPEHLHLTLVFLGETPDQRKPAIEAVIREAAAPPFELTFSKAGFFKKAGKELWRLGAAAVPPAGPEEDTRGFNELRRLQQCLAAGLLAAGFSIDTRPFNAHITLGREIRSALSPFTVEAITVPVSRISLMKSERRGGALVYTEVYGKDTRHVHC